jgi:UDP-N-acetylmuramoylalanine--D-glutamate ligase
MSEVVSSFQGVEHRLEFVREVDGVSYYNDSIATSPERTAAALRAFDEPIVLLAGGQDKNLPWHELALLMLERTRGVVLFGQAAEVIERVLSEAIEKGQIPGDDLPAIEREDSLEEAVIVARRLARPGDVVLLSPGGTSYDAFKDFDERGAFFKDLVRALS